MANLFSPILIITLGVFVVSCEREKDPDEYPDLQGKILFWPGNTFIESTTNDGSISTELALTLTNEWFVPGTLTLGTHFVVANIPEGLTVSINRNSDTLVTVSLEGKAKNHLITSNISNLSIAFTDAAFRSGKANSVKDASKKMTVLFTNGSSVEVMTMNDLRALSPPVKNGSVALMDGYHIPGDDGAGGFYWDSNSMNNDNGGTVICPNGYYGTGRWIRYVSDFNIVYFGAKKDDPDFKDNAKYINNAIKATPNGGTLNFAEGTYYAKLVYIEKKSNITFLGSESGSILKSSKYCAIGNALVRTNNADSMTFRNLTFDGNKGVVAGTEASGTLLLQINYCKGLKISGCTFCNNGYGAISLYSTSGVYVNDNNFYNTDCFVITQGKASHDITVLHNTMDGGTSEAVSLFCLDDKGEYTTNVYVIENTIKNRVQGAFFRQSQYYYVIGNIMENCIQGVGHGSGQPSNRYGVIYGNKITNGRDCGIRGTKTSSTVVANNTISEINACGIWTSGWEDCHIVDNVITNVNRSNNGNDCIRLGNSKNLLVEFNQCLDTRNLNRAGISVLDESSGNNIFNNIAQGTIPIYLRNDSYNTHLQGNVGSILDQSKSGTKITTNDDIGTPNITVTDATLSLKNDRIYYKFSATSAQTVNSIAYAAREGQLLCLGFAGPNISVNSGLNIQLSGNFQSAKGSLLVLKYSGGTWHEACRYPDAKWK